MILLKINHGAEHEAFTYWLFKWQEELYEPGKGVMWRRYYGDRADIFELYGNEKLVAYAKLKWGGV